MTTKTYPIIDNLLLHEKEIRGFLQRRLGCRHMVADIFQDLAERVLRRPPQDLASPRSYFFQAASNAVIDYRRTEIHRRRHAEEQLLDDEFDLEQRTPERHALAQEKIDVIEAALAELAPLTRQIFYLYRLEELSQQQIADRLGISRSTVERRLSKAVAHWQKRLLQAESGR